MNDSQLYIATYVDIKRDFTPEGIALLVLYRDSRSRDGGGSINVLRESSRPNRFAIIESCMISLPSMPVKGRSRRCSSDPSSKRSIAAPMTNACITVLLLVLPPERRLEIRFAL